MIHFITEPFADKYAYLFSVGDVFKSTLVGSLSFETGNMVLFANQSYLQLLKSDPFIQLDGIVYKTVITSSEESSILDLIIEAI